MGAVQHASIADWRVFRTSAGPIEIPASSLPTNPQLLTDGSGEIEHPPGVWLRERVREMAIIAEQYDFSLSLLLLDDAQTPYYLDLG